ncbi:PREDICTED: uncharacterized protein LOC105152872 [Acromyrmex echinatior]|uniref:uncharacterized protein LOC105152872 n=1 Tax=Acromyrmex echinatior TaxID=103372 RepID=UPI000580EEF6|nr:PREDICTED: uncharacterized protein LOC105152872 [Acromyrmex echinatior]
MKEERIYNSILDRITNKWNRGNRASRSGVIQVIESKAILWSSLTARRKLNNSRENDKQIIVDKSVKIDDDADNFIEDTILKNLCGCAACAPSPSPSHVQQGITRDLFLTGISGRRRVARERETRKIPRKGENEVGGESDLAAPLTFARTHAYRITDAAQPKRSAQVLSGRGTLREPPRGVTPTLWSLVAHQIQPDINERASE